MPSANIGIVFSSFNSLIVDQLVTGAKKAFENTDYAIESCIGVPGAFEIPYALQCLLAKDSIVGAVTIGAIIRGDTPHFEYISQASFQGIMDVSLAAKKPVTNGILTVNTMEQALERCGIKTDNKGTSAAQSLIALLQAT